MEYEIDFVVKGEPASAKNQRQIVQVQGKPRIIKSKKAFSYIRMFDAQCPVLDDLIEDDVALRVDVWYASRRPDLACMDLIQDLLQGKIYLNDRQVKASMSVWNLDRENPRSRIRLIRMEPESSARLSSLKLSEIWGPE
jgi:hypothetical protein